MEVVKKTLDLNLKIKKMSEDVKQKSKLIENLETKLKNTKDENWKLREQNKEQDDLMS